MKQKSTVLFVFFSIILVFMLHADPVKAGTVYVSDEMEHQEGYIIIGESHAVLSSDGYSRFLNADGSVQGLQDVFYSFSLDSSVYVDESGGADTFTMKGNLFFVFEGVAAGDADIQLNKNYIFSDGKGKQGIGVEKIHQIMDTNPNIKHWNIISYHGAISALKGVQDANYYIDSYRNWISYEFPKASIYFVSHSTMTKFYKQNRNAHLFDDAIKAAFPTQYFDMTAFYKQRYPQEMYDPALNPDTIHWNHKTYVELFNSVINTINSAAYTEKCKLLRLRALQEMQFHLPCKSTPY